MDDRATKQRLRQEADLAFAEEVDRLGAIGYTRQEIADRLDLTVWQVRARLRRIRLRQHAEVRVWREQVRLGGRRFRPPSGELP